MQNEFPIAPRRKWQPYEVMALLHACIKRRDEFGTKYYRAKVMSQILEDLKKQKVLTMETTLPAMQLKIKKLRLKWRRCKKEGTKSAPFFELLEVLFKDDPLLKEYENSKQIPLYMTTEKLRQVEPDFNCEHENSNSSVTVVNEPILPDSEDEFVHVHTNYSKQTHFKHKMIEIKNMLNQRQNILTNYKKEKQRLKIKALLTKQRRKHERAQMLNMLLKKSQKLQELDVKNLLNKNI